MNKTFLEFWMIFFKFFPVDLQNLQSLTEKSISCFMNIILLLKIEFTIP